ncbi:MAG: metallophosphoesterase [Planctomycetes bacterium]|nr:metallophosphoesterase [Planctomycetota bacterium]
MSSPPDADHAVRSLREAAGLLREDPIRRGATLHFGNAGQLVLTGDMHGNLKNFEKLQRFCALERSPARYVLLHELIHQEVQTERDMDLSIDLLVAAAAWKVAFPDNVYFMQSNHELAQLRGQEITKGGRSVLLDFERGVAYRYGRHAAGVIDAVCDYIAALPLAARTANGVFASHSLPDPLLLEIFDPTLLDREPTPQELSPGGPAYSLVWGRFHSPEAVQYFAQKLGVSGFVIGHTPQEDGYKVIGRMIILASDHNHGCFLPLDLNRPMTVEQMESSIRKFVSVP